MQRSRWESESRTAVEVVAEWASEFPTKKEAAAAIGISDALLGMWLSDSTRGLGRESKEKLSSAIGIFYEAIDHKTEPVRDVYKRARRSMGHAA